MDANGSSGGGMGSSPSYGHGYTKQMMLLYDKPATAGKALSWLANATYDPEHEYKVRRSSPYYFYERTYSPDAVGKIKLEEGCGALNLVNVSEPLKISRLLLGVDDLNPDVMQLIPYSAGLEGRGGRELAHPDPARHRACAHPI